MRETEIIKSLVFSLGAPFIKQFSFVVHDEIGSLKIMASFSKTFDTVAVKQIGYLFLAFIHTNESTDTQRKY